MQEFKCFCKFIMRMIQSMAYSDKKLCHTVCLFATHVEYKSRQDSDIYTYDHTLQNL